MTVMSCLKLDITDEKEKKNKIKITSKKENIRQLVYAVYAVGRIRRLQAPFNIAVIRRDGQTRFAQINTWSTLKKQSHTIQNIANFILFVYHEVTRAV